MQWRGVIWQTSSRQSSRSRSTSSCSIDFRSHFFLWSPGHDYNEGGRPSFRNMSPVWVPEFRRVSCNRANHRTILHLHRVVSINLHLWGSGSMGSCAEVLPSPLERDERILRRRMVGCELYDTFLQQVSANRLQRTWVGLHGMKTCTEAAVCTDTKKKVIKTHRKDTSTM